MSGLRLKCLGCGHTINISDEYEKYSGNIRCDACPAILRVRLEDSRLLEMEFLHFAKTPDKAEIVEKRI